MAEDKEKKATAANDELIAAACKAYGIAPKYVFASSVNAAGQAVILTNGGTRVRFKAGDKVEPLGQIAITGINPNPKRKPITGAAKE
jgi:hypothetical protein